MNNKCEFVKEAQQILSEGQLLIDEPMKLHTTFKIGGPADFLIFPANIDELKKTLSLISKYELPLTIIGNGSNILVLDKGIRGAVIKLGAPMSYIRQEGTKLIAGAGALLKDVSAFAAEHDLSGLEFACGIPGSIGGAVFMNAGAYDGETKNVVTGVTAVTIDGHIVTYNHDELDFGYRHSVFQDNGQAIAEIEISLIPGDRSEIQEKIEGFTQRRESKQPLEMPSAGSTFKRPQGYYAGTLIDQTGLKGFRIGGAQVSEKHAGFVVNAGNATANDVLSLIKAVQQKVYKKHGVKLFPEVRIVGEK